MENKLRSFLLFYGFILIPVVQFAQENEAPEVKIISPLENVALKSGSIIPYSITVSDKEDGNTEYYEINSKEVILTTTYFSDATEIKKYINETISSRSSALSIMASSNCFTCHKAKDKLIGPSFEEIANRYSPTSENKGYLTQKINQGSSGVWSDVIMPAQPELEEEEISLMLDWIFKNAQDPNYTFYVGTEGAFKTKMQSNGGKDKAAYVLHAFYSDHGLNGDLEKSKKGEHTVVLNVE